MPVYRTETIGKETEYFQQTVPIPTSSVVILMVDNMIKDFTEIDRNSIWHKEDGNSNFRYIQIMAREVMLYSSKFIGINATKVFPKVEHVVIPNNPVKSMSKPGLVVYRYTMHIDRRK